MAEGSMAPATDGRAGLLAILAATAVAGAGGYLIQVLAPRFLTDAHEYLSFSVFWSTLYLIGSAVGGIQQEVARATRPAPAAASGSGRALRGLALGGSLVVVALSGLVGLTVAPTAFAGSSAGMASALAVGLVGYVATSIVTGLLYGVARLRDVALLISLDAILRAGAVAVCFAASAPPDAIAFAVAAPFGLAVAVVWLIARPHVAGRYELDVSPRELVRGTLHTVLAAAATGVIVTGLPLLFRIALHDASLTAVAALTLVVTLTRAPFIIPLMALQSYLTVSYRDDLRRAHGRMWRYLTAAAVAAAIAAVLAWFFVPGLIGIISAGAYVVTPGTSALVVVSAVLVGCLCITGPSLLARGRHRAYSAGWVTAAVLTVALLFLLPLAPEARALGALMVAPIAGLAVHLVAEARASAVGSPAERSPAEGE